MATSQYIKALYSCYTALQSNGISFRDTTHAYPVLEDIFAKEHTVSIGTELLNFSRENCAGKSIHFYKCINCLLPNCVCSPQGNPHVCCDFVPAMLTEIILLNNFTLPSFQQTYVMMKPISFLNQRKIGSQYALESLTVKLLCGIFVAQSNFRHVMWIFRSWSER